MCFSVVAFLHVECMDIGCYLCSFRFREEDERVVGCGSGPFQDHPAGAARGFLCECAAAFSKMDVLAINGFQQVTGWTS